MSLIGRKGEWVTRESDDACICRLSRDLYGHEVVSATGWAEDWQVEPPVDGTAIDNESGWIRTNYAPNGEVMVELHFADGWR